MSSLFSASHRPTNLDLRSGSTTSADSADSARGLSPASPSHSQQANDTLSESIEQLHLFSPKPESQTIGLSEDQKTLETDVRVLKDDDKGIEGLLRQLWEAKAARELAERKMKEAEEEAKVALARLAEIERGKTLQDCRNYLDDLLLVQIKKLNTHTTSPNISHSSWRSKQKKGKPIPQRLPDEVCFDVEMEQHLQRFPALLDALLKPVDGQIDGLTQAVFDFNHKTVKHTSFASEADSELFWYSMPCQIFVSIIETLARLVTEARDDVAKEATRELTAMFPRVPWENLQGRLQRGSQKSSGYSLGCAPDSHDYKISPSVKQGVRVPALQNFRLDTRGVADHQQAFASISEDCVENSEGIPADTSGKSAQPTRMWSTCDIYSRYLTNDGRLEIYHITEMKAFDEKNSKSVEAFFRRGGTKAPRSSRKKSSSSISDGARGEGEDRLASTHAAGLKQPHDPAVEDGDGHRPGQQQAYGDLLLKGQTADAIDHQGVNILTQCFTYMSTHVCLNLQLFLGFGSVFFRYDAKRRMDSLRNKAQEPEPIRLLYYPVSQNVDGARSAEGDQIEKWRPHALLDATLYSMLRGLSDSFLWTPSQRRSWSADVVASGLDPRTFATSTSANATTSGADTDAQDDRGGNTAPRPGDSGSDSAGHRQGESSSDDPDSNAHRRGYGRGDRITRSKSGLARDRTQTRTERNNLVTETPSVSHSAAWQGTLDSYVCDLLDTSKTSDGIFSQRSEDISPWCDLYTEPITDSWCSPRCLLGLKYGFFMDEHCPNVRSHCKDLSCRDHSQHPHTVTLEAVSDGILEELRCGQIHRLFEPIATCRGAYGQLFRLQHPRFGYVFAAKGVCDSNAEGLVSENGVYDHIWSQLLPPNKSEHRGRSKALPPFPCILSKFGFTVHVPLSCGIVSLRENLSDAGDTLPYFHGPLGGETAYETFLLMSHHSLSLEQPEAASEANYWLPPELQDNGDAFCSLRHRCWRALLDFGVDHDDLQARNVLWDSSLRAAVVIDFGHVRIHMPKKRSSSSLTAGSFSRKRHYLRRASSETSSVSD